MPRESSSRAVQSGSLLGRYFAVASSGTVALSFANSRWTISIVKGIPHGLKDYADGWEAEQSLARY